MKKSKFCYILTLVFIISALASMPVFATYTTVEEGSADSKISYGDWINEEGEYEFPITQYDDEWYELEDVTEMRAVTQIPEEILKDISTEDLVQLVLEYPLLCDINAFMTIEEGYEHIKNQFNGVRELLSRNDAYEKLIEVYEVYNIPSERIVNYDIITNSEDAVEILNSLCKNKAARNRIYEDAAVNDSINILEFLLNDVIECLGIDAEEFVNIYIEKAEQKNMSNYYASENTYTLITAVMDNDINIFSEFVEINSVESNETIVFYSPGGNRVEAQYFSKLVMCDTGYQAALVAEYNASYVSIASRTFNCHSFAWLQNYRSDYQHIWLNSATPFTTDSYYKSSTTGQVGDIANWATHSAKVVRVDVDTIEGPQYYCISKWGDGPIVMHYVDNCPYYFWNSNIKFYQPAE